MSNDPWVPIDKALSELGLCRDFLLRAFVAENLEPKFTNGKWDLKKINIVEWAWICKKLYLPFGVRVRGYCRRIHGFSVGDAILEGSFLLPMTDNSKSLFRKYLSDKRNDRKSENFYGERMQNRFRLRRRKEIQTRRMIRKSFLESNLDVRNHFLKLHTQSKIGPLLTYKLRKSTEGRTSIFVYSTRNDSQTKLRH